MDANVFGGSIDRASDLPAHLQVRQAILNSLSGGQLLQGQRLPGEPEIAKRFGVSRMTANKAILALVADGWLIRQKGRGTFVVERPQGKVERCLVAMDARAVNGAPSDYYYGALYWEIQRFFQSRDIRIDVGELPSELVRAASIPAGTAVIATNPGSEDGESLLRFHAAGTPIVVLGSSWDGGRLHSVDSDNILGATLAVNHLADLGHRRIAFLGAFPEDSNTIDRLRGFRVTMKARGLEVSDGDVHVMAADAPMDSEVVAGLMARLTGTARATAVFAAGPRLAMLTLSLAQRLDLRIPEQLSVVAYDDPSFLDITSPPLTTIRQPLAEMARNACLLVVSRPEPMEGIRRVLLDPELVVRRSTASPSALTYANGK